MTRESQQKRRGKGQVHSGFRAKRQLTYFFDGVFFILKHHAACLVHGGFDSVLLAKEVEELGGAELVPPLVRSRAEAQTQDKDDMLQDTDEGRGACSDLCTHTHSIIQPLPLQWAPHLVIYYDWGSPLYRQKN